MRYNFSAGPAAVPSPVIEKVSKDLSIFELSHRSNRFEQILNDAKQRMRTLLQIPRDFEVLFLPGGASLQFYMAPLNLMIPGRGADLIDSGHWSNKARYEIEKVGDCRVVASSEAVEFKELPEITESTFNPDASFIYLTSNNTIYGTQWKKYPESNTVPLVVDMTSDILSRTIDFSNIGLAFASAQKNLGIAGVTLVIIRKDLAERCSHDVATMLQYRTHIAKNSLYNTAPTFSIYLTSLVLEWVESQGGIEGLEKVNREKSQKLYDYIDQSHFYHNRVKSKDRSVMNVIFRLTDTHLEEQFVKEANAKGLIGLKGHRTAGGLRASLYNAVSMDAVDALIEFMSTFSGR